MPSRTISIGWRPGQRVEPKTVQPQGEIVWERVEFGHHFQIERLDPPVSVGAGERHYRLWDNGFPASGSQWCYDLEHAQRRVEYLLQGSYIRRIEYLEQWVGQLESERAARTTSIIA